MNSFRAFTLDLNHDQSAVKPRMNNLDGSERELRRCERQMCILERLRFFFLIHFSLV